ncbi:hypothetical protein NDN16_18360 [Aureimonas altamirensis]|uniref:hypothetical protein n=1 Tax=Aureimonas altamirensis TaxID=370622 RepID=UPI0020367F58|nr:hypothetical protein [Aureimonas altamirensis]MCM2505633.1 hypothetical protein [Aureimonas altamirensis]
MTEALSLSLDVGTIMTAKRSPNDTREDFFQITRIVSRATVELRQIVVDQNGNPVASAFVAPPFTTPVAVEIQPDRQGVVWGNPSDWSAAL